DPDLPGVEGPPRLRVVLVDHVAPAVADRRDPVGLGVDPAGGEGGVGGGHRQRAHAPVEASEEDGALGFGGVGGDAGVGGGLDHAAHADLAAEVDEHDVDLVLQGGVDVYGAAEVRAGVVLDRLLDVAGDYPARGAVERAAGV